jgi:hypothetical protein
MITERTTDVARILRCPRGDERGQREEKENPEDEAAQPEWEREGGREMEVSRMSPDKVSTMSPATQLFTRES